MSPVMSWAHQHRRELALAALATTAIGTASFINSYNEAQLVVSEVANARRTPSTPLSTAESSQAAPQSTTPTNNTLAGYGASDVDLTHLRTPARPPQFSVPTEHATETTPSGHSYMVDGLQGFAVPLADGAAVPADMLSEVRAILSKELPLTLTDEALTNGLLRTQTLVEGLAQDLKMNLKDPNIKAAIIRTFVDYKWAEAYLEARSAFGLRSFSEMQGLTPDQWSIISTRVANRGPLQKMQLGQAMWNEFLPSIQQQLQTPQQASLPSWRR